MELSDINLNYRICKTCHSMFPEDDFKGSCTPNTIPIIKCPYCKDKDKFIKVKIKIEKM